MLPKFDVWSVGCLISEVFTGVFPWKNGVRNQDQVKKHLIFKLPFPISGNIPKLIKPLVEMSTAVKVKERVSVERLAEAIQKLLADNQIDSI